VKGSEPAEDATDAKRTERRAASGRRNWLRYNSGATCKEFGGGQVELSMDRRELLLAVLAAGGGRAFQPAQIQKAVFLITTNLPHLIHNGPRYNFQAYNYGPFDRNVYVEAEHLRDEGAALIAPSANGRWMTYAASDTGINRGQHILSRLTLKSRRYVGSVAGWVLAQSFGSLVKSIYDAYPEMKENSIFQG
jgi:hypothetical protein